MKIRYFNLELTSTLIVRNKYLALKIPVVIAELIANSGS